MSPSGPISQHLSPWLWLHHHLPCHHHSPQCAAHRQAGLHSHHSSPQHCPFGAWQRAEVHRGLSAPSWGEQRGAYLPPFSGPCSILNAVPTRCQCPLWRETRSWGQPPSRSRDSKGQWLPTPWAWLTPACTVRLPQPLTFPLWTRSLGGQEVYFLCVTFFLDVQPVPRNKSWVYN